MRNGKEDTCQRDRTESSRNEQRLPISGGKDKMTLLFNWAAQEKEAQTGFLEGVPSRTFNSVTVRSENTADGTDLKRLN